MREIWKQSVSLPEYMVSSLGRVMRIPYQSPMPYGGVRTYGGQKHRGQLSGDRYIFVFRGKSYKVHILVCEAFHGPKPFPRAVAMHQDEDAMNNRERNLKWGTQKQNLNAAGFIEYCRNRRRKQK